MKKCIICNKTELPIVKENDVEIKILCDECYKKLVNNELKIK